MNQQVRTQQVNLTAEQVQRAAKEGVKLLSDEDRVNVPPSMAMSGSYQVLIGMLTALATGEVVMGNPEPVPTSKGGDDGKGEGPTEE